MAQKNADRGRRNLLKKLAVGTGTVATLGILPEKWTKPVIDKIIVPAHAQTSEPQCSFIIDNQAIITDPPIAANIVYNGITIPPGTSQTLNGVLNSQITAESFDATTGDPRDLAWYVNGSYDSSGPSITGTLDRCGEIVIRGEIT